jgi:hypothetical protein
MISGSNKESAITPAITCSALEILAIDKPPRKSSSLLKSKSGAAGPVISPASPLKSDPGQHLIFQINPGVWLPESKML